MNEGKPIAIEGETSTTLGVQIHTIQPTTVYVLVLIDDTLPNQQNLLLLIQERDHLLREQNNRLTRLERQQENISARIPS